MGLTGGTSSRVIFLTHAEVTIDPDVPVPDWGLNPVGQARHAAFAERSEVGGVTSIYCSTER
ncbi:MAG: histidine phosphatase family protein, partial [Pseudomonadota bacterium]